MLRFGYVDRDDRFDSVKGNATDEVRHYEAGLNYYIAKQEARLMSSWSIFDFHETQTRHEVILGAQVSF